MFSLKKSILVSNVLDPLTRDPIDLKMVYERLFKENRYESIEIRLIKNQQLIKCFNKLRTARTSVTYYITGDLTRNNLSLSTVNCKNRIKAIDYCKESLKDAQKTNCNYMGIASGRIEENALLNLDLFVDSMNEIMHWIEKKGLGIKLAIEPLDQYAHKKNVVGSLDMTCRLINKLENLGWNENHYILTWDSAHVALNEDDFETSIKSLSKYIYKVHFANAVLDKSDDLYGDYHIDFKKGFMDLKCARRILQVCKKYINHPIEVSCEVREKNIDHCWGLEEELYEFLNEAMNI